MSKHRKFNCFDIMFAVLGIFFWVLIFYFATYHNETDLIKQYDIGVGYYNQGEYTKAIEYLEPLKTWGIGERDGTKMFEQAKHMELMSKDDEYYICPECGQPILLKDLEKVD